MKFWELICGCFKGKKTAEDNGTKSRGSSMDSQAAAENIRNMIAKGLIPENEEGTLFRDPYFVNVSVTDNTNLVRESGDVFHHRYSE